MSNEPREVADELDSDDARRYRRPRRPIEVRRRARWWTGVRIGLRILLGLTALALVVGAAFYVHRFATSATVFAVADLESVDVVNAERVTPAAVRERFAEDVGRTVFAVPLGERRLSVEEIPWVEAATVQRVFPNRLRVYVRERTPVAFLRQGQSLWLVDGQGVVLAPPEGASYSFPVLSGVPETLTAAERRSRLGLFLEFVADLDQNGKAYSEQISELDLGDADNLRASVADGDGAVYLYFGRGRYQEKFETYLEHRRLWQQSGETVRAVDLRYRGQIVLNPESGAEPAKR